jgi:hypothetical protein
MKDRYLLFLGFLAISAAFVSCNSATSPTDLISRGRLTAEGLQVVVSTSRTGAGSMTFRIGVENGGPANATLNFACGQFFDIEVSRDGNVVWRWSHDKYFTQALWGLELTPGESYAQTADWDLTGNDGKRLSSGTYTAQITITSYPRDDGLVTEISITI